MYFQVCSNSGYPQQSGERYRTNGPLVYNISQKLKGGRLQYLRFVMYMFYVYIERLKQNSADVVY